MSVERRSGEDRRQNWRSWIYPIVMRAINAGMTEDQFLRTILSPKREEVREFYREMLNTLTEEQARERELALR